MELKKITNSNFFYLIAGVILALFINQGLALVLGTDIPIVAVESNSMVPTFSQGDILVLMGVAREDIQVRDIIVFLPEGHNVPIVHRVITINDDGTFQTKGDANTHQFPFEKSIPYDQIKGREIIIIPYLGWVKIKAAELIQGIVGLFS